MRFVQDCILCLYLRFLQFPGLSTADDHTSISNPQDIDAMSDTILMLPPSTTSTSPVPFEEGQLNIADDDNLVGSDVIRRKPYGTGLANLGNTCFMVRCIAAAENVDCGFESHCPHILSVFRTPRCSVLHIPVHCKSISYQASM